MKKFQELELDPRIKKGLFDSGLIETFPIQEKTIDPLLLKRDVIGQAKQERGRLQHTSSQCFRQLIQKKDVFKL